MTSLAPVEDKLDLRDKFLSVLKAAATQRKRRTALVSAPGGVGRSEPEWVAFERRAMAEVVDAARAARGLAAASPERLQRAERIAVGHVDYMEKFALYCAEIALGENDAS